MLFVSLDLRFSKPFFFKSYVESHSLHLYVLQLDEVRAKERLISDLGKEVGHAGHIAARIQVERDSLDALLKLAESWEKKPTKSEGSSKGSGSPVTDTFDFDIPVSTHSKIRGQLCTD